MDELISKRQAIDALRDWEMCYDWDEHCREEPKAPWVVSPSGVINKLPSAEPERPRGRWIPVDSYSAFGGDEATWMAHGNPVAFYYCSECKKQAYAGEDGESLLTDYCPNCGADMRGEQYG